ncbi:TadE/TadG family type IV pilus assembly protein [Hydrogenophaga sp.]
MKPQSILGAAFRRQRGSAMIEFVVVGPLITLLGTTVLQYALMFNAKNMVNHASFLAAREGSVANANLSAVQQAYAMSQEVVPMPREPGNLDGRGNASAQLPVQVKVATRQSPDGASRIVLAAGYYPLLHGAANPKAAGLTLMCTPKEPDALELEKSIGIWPTRRIQDVVSAKGTLPSDMVEKILVSDYPGPLQALASYHGLTSTQVDRLLARAIPQVDQYLAESPAVELNPTQIDTLISRNRYAVGNSLIMRRLSQLSPAQREALSQSPQLADLLVIRQGGEPARAHLEKQLRSRSDDEMQGIFGLYELTSAMVDTVLAFGSDALRSRMAMQSHFVYTPAQIERMLTDKNRDVQIGVLRRRDLPLTREQYDRGLAHPDKGVVFWYSQREGFNPTATQVEAALTDPEPATRRGMVLRKDVDLTPEQVKRALQDPALRAMVIARADVRLSETELDSCTVDRDVNTRFACVRRSDYTLSDLRWNSIARDSNGNVLRFLLQSKKATPLDWPRWLEKSLREDPPEVQQKLLRERLLPFTPDLLRLAAKSIHPTVRRSACERDPAVCQ